MEQQPGEPRREARQLQPPDSGYGAAAADRGHDAAVHVAEALARRALEAPHDLAGYEAALLHRHGAHAGQRFSITLRNEAGRVPDAKHLRVSGHAGIGADHDPPVAIERDA